MSSKDRRAEKARKAKTRDKRKAMDRLNEAAATNKGRNYLNKWPLLFVQGTEKADPEFVRLVTDAMRQFNFETIGDGMERRFYELWADCKDWNEAYEALKQASTLAQKESETARLVPAQMQVDFGERIWKAIGQENLAPFYPWCNATFMPRGNSIVAHFTSLVRVKRSSSFYSPHRPKVELDGEARTLVWSKHVLDRVAERRQGDRRSYAAWGDTFGFFHSFKKADPVTLYPDQPGVIVWDLVGTDVFSSYALAKACKPSIAPGEAPEWLWKAGYCPLVLSEEGHALAKTFLTPGWEATPEYGEIMRRHRTLEERKKWQKLLDNQFPDCEEDYIDLARQFQEWGHMQLYHPKNLRDYFDPDIRFDASATTHVMPAHMPKSLAVRANFEFVKRT